MGRGSHCLNPSSWCNLESYQLTWVTQFVWIVLHSVVGAIIFTNDSMVMYGIQHHDYVDVIALGLSFLVMVVFFLLTMCVKPGFVDLEDGASDFFETSSEEGGPYSNMNGEGYSYTTAASLGQPLLVDRPQNVVIDERERRFSGTRPDNDRSGEAHSFVGINSGGGVSSPATAGPDSGGGVEGFGGSGEGAVNNVRSQSRSSSRGKNGASGGAGVVGGDMDIIIPDVTSFNPLPVQKPNDPLLFCAACGVFQPLRAKHCMDCQRCVRKYDHHCIWIGQCVGERNHRYFWWYTFMESALCVWAAAELIYALHTMDLEIGVFLGKNWSILIGMFILFVFSSMPISLCLFHTYLIMTNQTSREYVVREKVEYLRGVQPNVRPFSGGVLWNLYSSCCSVYSDWTLDDKYRPRPTV